MSHRNSANVTSRNRQLALVAALVNARPVASIRLATI